MMIDGLPGVTAIDTKAAEVTVSSWAMLVTPLEVAVMFDVPGATLVARPLALIVAALIVAEFHVTVEVMFSVLLSL